MDVRVCLVSILIFVHWVALAGRVFSNYNWHVLQKRYVPLFDWEFDILNTEFIPFDRQINWYHFSEIVGCRSSRRQWIKIEIQSEKLSNIQLKLFQFRIINVNSWELSKCNKLVADLVFQSMIFIYSSKNSTVLSVWRHFQSVLDFISFINWNRLFKIKIIKLLEIFGRYIKLHCMYSLLAVNCEWNVNQTYFDCQQIKAILIVPTQTNEQKTDRSGCLNWNKGKRQTKWLAKQVRR